MGLSRDGVRFLLYAKRLGVDFSRTATLGRQRLDVARGHLQSEFSAFHHAVSAAEVARIASGAGGYADELFRWLGARELHMYDKSAYEGATHLHDMNAPVPESTKGAYTSMLDGGSLEHIFDFPTAIRNCMQMLAVGGHYLAITPANNFMGHGFYQFSPELYFSVFSGENGFEVVRMIASEDRARAPWYRVKDPREAGGRVTLRNRRPVNLMVLARRSAELPIFAVPPQQSDYVALWSRAEAPSSSGLLARVIARIPKRLALWLWKVFRAPGAGFNRRFFEPFDPTR